MLRMRVRDYALAAASDAAHPDALAYALAQAAGRALDQVVAHPGDRSVALDLLAADGLITLALLAQAQSVPERLGDFAASMLRTGRPNG